MTRLQKLYRTSWALLTDLYQLTMAHGYWTLGLVGREAVYHLTFCKSPFRGGCAVAAGLESAVDDLNDLRFERGFLDAHRDIAFRCDGDAIPEGSVSVPHEPQVRVRGPLLHAQLVENDLLTLIKVSSTLIATKPARISHTSRGEPVLEFDLRSAASYPVELSADLTRRKNARVSAARTRTQRL